MTGLVTRQYTHLRLLARQRRVRARLRLRTGARKRHSNRPVENRRKFNGCNKFYANLYLGDTKNEFRDMHRDFNGYDLRLINTRDRPSDADRLREPV